jgi:hypothetical protein
MRFGFAVIVIGWSGPGSFMMMSLSGSRLIGRTDPTDFKRLDKGYSVTARDLEERPG